MLFDDVFKNKTPIYANLIPFGFVLHNGVYIYTQRIVDNQFDFIVSILPDGHVHTQVIDLSTGDEYTLHLVEGIEGSFIGKVRTDCLNILHRIAATCFATQIFKSSYACQIIQYIKDKYHHNLEYLWQKFPENAAVRRSDNHKWYALLMTVEASKIGLNSHDKIEIIDLRGHPDEIKHLIDGQKYFPAYHMNKTSWLTICLDGRVDLAEILSRLDESYNLAKSKL